MLVELRVQNLVLIEKLVLPLHAGFNVLTGETGAGKSMLALALALVLGGRARADVVRGGTQEAEIEALFEVAAGTRAAAKLEAGGVPCEGELAVRRVIQAEGKSRAFLNGRLATAAQLAELAPELCDISSQHESVTLTNPATHLEYLDAFGQLDELREQLGGRVDELGKLGKRLDLAREAERGRTEREDFLAFQLREIDDLNPRAGEETDLEAERVRLRHAGRLAETTRRAAERLDEGQGALCDELGRLAADLAAAAELDSDLAPFAKSAATARVELVDAARGLARYAESIEEDPARLAEVDERFFRLQKILRKHGPTTADLLDHRRHIELELASSSQAADHIARLEAEREALLAELRTQARLLSERRAAAADRLATAVGRELTLLGMGSARVVVEVAPHAGIAGALELDGARLTRSGVDRVEFLIAPNRGEDPRPLRRIASGGELSRALLALKRVLAEKGPAGLYVFDEVDAGVGGAIAQVLGRSIADVARHRQVLCITHLPQIAALADAHFVVDKSESRGRTTTRVRRLDEPERVDEIARMIGGVRVGNAARQAAAELLSEKVEKATPGAPSRFRSA